HIRHLYYNEDHLPVLALYGGLDIWVFRNTEKILESSTSARDDFSATPSSYATMHALFTSILDYLDGIPNVHVDVPPGTPITPDQLAQPAALAVLDDLVTHATYAYTGQLDPNTNTVKPGVLQVHYDVLRLATFDITKNVPQSL